MCGVPLAVVGEMLGHKHARTTQRYAHLANHVVRQGLEAATDRIVAATRPVPMLEPPPFERLTDREWKRIAAIVEATRGTCGGTRTDLRRAVDAVRWVLHNGAKWRELPAGPRDRHDVLAVVRALVRRWDVAADRGGPRVAGIEVGREPRHTARSAARPKPTIDVAAIEVGPSTARQGPPVRLTSQATRRLPAVHGARHHGRPSSRCSTTAERVDRVAPRRFMPLGLATWR
jgi:hypothetical protein